MLTNEEREFCGWFWGEGYMGIHKRISPNAKAKNYNYLPVIKVVQRDDDIEILKWCVKRFGGRLWLRKEYVKGVLHASPRMYWEVAGYKRVLEIIKVLDQGIFLARKKKEIEIMKKFFLTKIGTGKVVTQEQLDTQEQLKQDLMNLKKYKPQ